MIMEQLMPKVLSQEIVNATKNDETLQCIMSFIESGKWDLDIRVHDDCNINRNDVNIISCA